MAITYTKLSMVLRDFENEVVDTYDCDEYVKDAIAKSFYDPKGAGEMLQKLLDKHIIKDLPKYSKVDTPYEIDRSSGVRDSVTVFPLL